MVQKKKNLMVICSAALIGILGVVTAELISSKGVFNFLNVNANVDTYSLTLNKNNAPTAGSYAHHEVRTTGGAKLDLTYEGASESATGHVTLAENGFIKFNSRVTGLYSVTPIFTGELTASFGLENDTLATQTLASGQEIYLAEGYYFNHVKLIAETATEVSSLVFKYTCSEAVDQITNPTVWTSNGGAIVRGINDVTYLGENVYLRVEPFMDNTVESVKLNGKDLTLDTETNCYVYQAGLNDNIQIQTSLKDKITAHMYTIDPETGAHTHLEDRQLDYTKSTDGYSYTVNAPTVEGYSVDKDYVKSVLDSEHQEASFYYSEVSTYDPSITETTLTGSGTAANPYLLKTANDWLMVGKINKQIGTVQGDKNCYKMTRTFDFSTLTDQALLRVSGSQMWYCGTFDGNYCAVRGLNAKVGTTVNPVNYPSQNGRDRLSLFYCVKGTLKNLSAYGLINGGVGTATFTNFAEAGSRLENLNSYVTVEQEYYNDAYSGSTNAGAGLVGSIKGGKLLNCTNYGSVTNKSHTFVNGSGESKSTNKTAGIAGVIEAGNSVIEHTFNFGNVSGAQYVCGIVPFANNEMTLALNDVYNFGSVHGETSAPAGIIGGVNLAYVDINGAYNFGKITAGAGITSWGGITLQVTPGTATSNFAIDNAYNFVDIIGTHNLGGISSYVTTTNLGNPAVFNNCKNFGSIISTKASGDSYIGGILGVGFTNTKEVRVVTELNNCENFGYVDGVQRAGGVLGAGAISTLNHCANYGDLGTKEGAKSLQWNGGIVATSANGKQKTSNVVVLDCANFGNIKVSSSAVGGIFGSPSGNASFSIERCANFGRIYSAGTYAGGICGQVSGAAINGNIANCVNYGRVTAATSTCAGVAPISMTTWDSKATWTYSNCFNYGRVICPKTFGDVFLA